MLSNQELNRYKRQLLLPNFDESHQEKLKNSKVLVVGAGGLGGPVSIYLAAAGVGHLVICDNDNVELSNLNRQILHTTQRINSSKATSAQKTLNNLNPEINIECHQVYIDENSISDIAKQVDLIIDCLDNIKTRKVLNHYIIKHNIPLLHAGINDWTAQITLVQPPQTACIECLFTEMKDDESVKPVLGATAGLVGTLQALEAIKVLIGYGSSLKGSILFVDTLNLDFTTIPLQATPNCPTCSTLKK